MTLARSILINALTRLVSRNAEATNINVPVAASFAEPNRIVVAYKQQRATTRCCTSAQTVSLMRGRYSSAVTQRCCADDR